MINKVCGSRNSFNICCVVVIFWIAVIVYANSIPNGFVYDDELVLTSNFFIKDIKNLPGLFTADYFNLSKEKTFRIIPTLSLFLQYQLFGYSPAGYHFVNFLLHLSNAVMVFLLALCLRFSKTALLFAPIVFLLNPSASETVFCVSYMEDLWGLSFFLGAVLMFLRYNFSGKSRYVFLSQVMYLLSLLSKEMGIVFLLLIPALIFFHDGIKILPVRKNIYFIGYTFFTTLAYIYLRFFIYHNPSGISDYPKGSLFITLFNIPFVITYYIKLIFFPVGLTADYRFDLYDNLFRFPLILSFIFLSLLFLLSFKMERKIGVWILFFIAALLPVLNIIPFGAVVAERYLYFSSVGFAMFISLLADKFLINLTGFGRLKLLCVFCVLFLCYSVLLVLRADDWKNNASLWRATAKRSPSKYSDKPELRLHLGNQYFKEGKLDLALREFQIAKKMDPSIVGSYNNIGIIYVKKGFLGLAKSEFKQAITMNENYVDPYFSLAGLYLIEKNYNKALSLINKILSLEPSCSFRAYQALYSIYKNNNDYQMALTYLLKSIEIDRKHEDSYINIAVIYSQDGKYNLASQILRDGIRQIPGSINIRLALAEVLLNCERFDESIKILNDVLMLYPDNAEAYAMLGINSYSQNHLGLAKEFLKKSLMIKPGQVKVLNYLGFICSKEGNMPDAKLYWGKSLYINQNQPEIKKLL